MNMYTRNLIGSLTVNASVLKDNEGHESFWFVLQDLSVRTEGWFRYVFMHVVFNRSSLTSSQAQDELHQRRHRWRRVE